MTDYELARTADAVGRRSETDRLRTSRNYNPSWTEEEEEEEGEGERGSAAAAAAALHSAWKELAI